MVDVVHFSDPLPEPPYCNAAGMKRLAELEAFVIAIGDIETQWVTGVVDSQTSMTDVSVAWSKVRRP